MPKEIELKGKKCRYYKDGYVWVSKDGTIVAYKEKTKDKQWGWPLTKTKYPRKKMTAEGNVYVETRFGNTVPVAKAVITCWCPPFPKDGKTYEIHHKDGNRSNNNASNLEWIEYHYEHTTANSTKIQYKDVVVTVSSDGTFMVGTQKVPIIDSLYDSDTDCHKCIGQYAVLYPKGKLLHGERVLPDTLMEMAGYVQGDDAGLKNPVILHKDLDWENFKSENLEFCEADDSQYLKYQDLIQENKKKRTLALNPGKHLPPGWV